MKKFLLSALSFMSIVAMAQDPVIEAWNITDGTKASYQYYPNPMSPTNAQTVNMSDTADILEVCYNATYVYVRTNGLPSYQMGPWEENPNTPAANSLIYKFPMTPQEETGTKTDQAALGAMAVAVNGVAIYGLSDSRSYNDEGYWNQNAWATEGTTMGPSGGGHPQQQGEYHYHATPAKLYDDPSTTHSPIVGYAFDGYPIYGPFGYTDPMDASSAIKRIKSSYAERNITARTNYADGSTAPSPGPNVSSQYPIGYYIEDHEYIASSGDLDEYNGRFCKTPEYPNGIYAYFVATDDNGDPAFPYMIGEQYYGKVSSADVGLNSGNNTIPTTGMTCLDINNPTVGIEEQPDDQFSVFPNPTSGDVTVTLGAVDFYTIEVVNILGEKVWSATVNTNRCSISMADMTDGVYFATITNKSNNNQQTIKVIKQ